METQGTKFEFSLTGSDGQVINRVYSEIPVMTPESASQLQIDLMSAMLEMHKAWHKQKFASAA
jgi:hypothetical protein